VHFLQINILHVQGVHVVCCRKLAEALKYVMHAVVYNHYVEPSWLYVVPLYHLLSNTVKPFTKSLEHSSHQTDSWWGTSGLERLVLDVKQKQRGSMLVLLLSALAYI